MIGCLRYICLFALLPHFLVAQIKVVKPPKTKHSNAVIGLGIGRASSVLNLPINTKNNNNAKGLNVILSYDQGKLYRGSFEYTYYGKIDISPTWDNVRAQTYEFNFCAISKNKENTLFFYPMAGISYNVFKGYFTGINDYLNLRSLYKKNETARLDWLGFNAGVGIDYNFNHNITLYGLGKLRVGKTEGLNQVNIMDVFFAAGLKYNFKGASLAKIFRGTRSRYLLK
jgi:hypothetical protein